MSLFASMNLQIASLNSGTDAKLEWQWDGGHVPSEIFSESLALYIDEIKHEELEKADRDLSPVTWCSFRNFFVPAITALHCLSASARVCKSSYQ